MRNNLFSAVEFLIVVIVLASGAFLMALPGAPAVRFKLAVFFMEHSNLFLPLGMIVVFIGLVLLFGFYWMNRRCSFRIEMKASKEGVEVEKDLVLSSLSIYWKQLFPKEDLMADVLIHRNQKIELIAEMPRLAEEEQKEILEKIEKEIGMMLAKQLGYEREFFFTVYFK